MFTVDDMRVLTGVLVNAVDAENFGVLDQWARTSAAVSTPANWFRDHFAHAPIWSFLSRIEVPVGLFHGEADVNTSVEGIRRPEAQARDAGRSNLRFQYFENADHSLNLGPYFVRGAAGGSSGDLQLPSRDHPSKARRDKFGAPRSCAGGLERS